MDLVCHTEWSKLEREKSYINTYTWDLEKWYGQTYLQERNRDTDVENECVGMEVGCGWDESGDWDWRVCTTMYKTAS